MLVLHVFFVFLAAFGLFCAIWAVVSFFLPSCSTGWICCSELRFVPTYLWLRGMGIVTCPLAVVNPDLSEEARNWLTHKEIEIWEREPS